MNDHEKKMIAPVIITVVFLLYLAAYVIGLITLSERSPVIMLLAVPLIALGIGMGYVLKTRITEIRSGEEDDLGNY